MNLWNWTRMIPIQVYPPSRKHKLLLWLHLPRPRRCKHPSTLTSSTAGKLSSIIDKLYEARTRVKKNHIPIYTKVLLNADLDEKQSMTAASWFRKITLKGTTTKNLVDAATELDIAHDVIGPIVGRQGYDQEKLERAILNDTRVYVLSILMRIGCSAKQQISLHRSTRSMWHLLSLLCQ
jgi:hypothetical protein